MMQAVRRDLTSGLTWCPGIGRVQGVSPFPSARVTIGALRP